VSGHDTQRTASNPADVQRAKNRERSGAMRDQDDLRVVMSTRPGRRLMRRYLAKCGVYKTITVQSSMIYALSGRRDVGLEMLDEILALEELYLLMETEAREDARLEQRENEAARTRAVTR
jgi:hypothetical protein